MDILSAEVLLLLAAIAASGVVGWRLGAAVRDRREATDASPYVMEHRPR